MGLACLLAGLLLLLLAGDTAATVHGSKMWLGYRCYLPGCSRCDNGNPYECLECNTGGGYVKLARNTCGCAAGYGSYAVPSTARFPPYPPSCPTFLPASSSIKGSAPAAAAAANMNDLVVTRSKSGTTRVNHAGRRVTPAVTRKRRTFSMHPKRLITPMTYYRNRPNYCWWGYHPTPVCQVPPAAGCGYCACAACPAGYTSTGGSSIATSVCVPKSSPSSVRCKGKPPQVPNGKAWHRTCSNILAGRKCGARGAPCNSGYVCEGCTPGSTKPIAYCEAPEGIWRVEGTCVASAGMADCPNKPKTAANAEAWPAECANGTAAVTPTVCNADCKAGYTGQVVATCTAGGWVVAGTCVKDGPAPGCPGSPERQPNAGDFVGCTDKEDGDICEAACEDGFTGGYQAVCGIQGDGTMGYTIGGECTPIGTGSTCAAPPDDPSVDWPADCADAPAESSCPLDGTPAPCAPGFDGSGGTATCFDDGTGTMLWDIMTDCQSGSQLTCEGLPDPNPASELANPWPEDDPVCLSGQPDDMCFADCVDGLTGGGATATCNGATGVWDVEVDCQSGSQLTCEGLPDPNPASELVNPWPEDDPVCLSGQPDDACFADCVDGLTGGGATATCNGATGVWDVEVDCL